MMLGYILKRILLMVPTMLVITLLAFVLSNNAPGDPVARFAGEEPVMNAGAEQRLNYEKLRQEYHHQLGLDLPVFYVSLHSLAQETRFRDVADPLQQRVLRRLTTTCGDETPVRNYFAELKAFEHKLYQVNGLGDSVYENISEIKARLSDLFFASGLEEIKLIQSDVQFLCSDFPELHESFQAVGNRILELSSSTHRWKNYVPVLDFHFPNRYHQWLFGDGIKTQGILRGDFGLSYQDSRSVTTLIFERLPATLLISFISIFLSYLLALPAGILSAYYKDKILFQWLNGVLMFMYAMPSFWVATLLINYLAGGDYLDWFPTYGLARYDSGLSSWGNFFNQLHHLVLPVFCWTYGGLAYLSKQTETAVLAEFNQDYTKTARAKGLGEFSVVGKHVFANSILPVITLFGNVFPALIGGAVVLEVIFNIPGMGELSYQAYHQKDYPVIMAVLTFGTLLTLIGYLISDILYAIADPRIKYRKES